MCACTGFLQAESAHYGLTFEGNLEGDLPLELEILHLIQKHGIHVQAQVSGSLAVSAASTIFDPVGTGSVELELSIGEIQQLSARLQRRGMGASLKAGEPVSIQFDPAAIAVRDPLAFPARVGAPSAGTEERAFVLSRIELALSPAALERLPADRNLLAMALSGKVFLRETGGKFDGRETALDLTITELSTRPRNLWETQEWKSLAQKVENLSFELDDYTLPLPLGDAGGGDDGGLIVIPEPAWISLLGGWAAALFVASRRSRFRS